MWGSSAKAAVYQMVQKGRALQSFSEGGKKASEGK